jgi:hypothetical protein
LQNSRNRHYSTLSSAGGQLVTSEARIYNSKNPTCNVNSMILLKSVSRNRQPETGN